MAGGSVYTLLVVVRRKWCSQFSQLHCPMQLQVKQPEALDKCSQNVKGDSVYLRPGSVKDSPEVRAPPIIVTRAVINMRMSCDASVT